MTEKLTKKGFDCLAYKREVQAQIYEETKDLSGPELIAYFREQSKLGPLGEWWATVQAQQARHEAGIKIDAE